MPDSAAATEANRQLDFHPAMGERWEITPEHRGHLRGGVRIDGLVRSPDAGASPSSASEQRGELRGD